MATESQQAAGEGGNSSAPLGVSGRIAAAFQDSRMTPLLALVAFLLGLFATLVTPREEEPQIDVTMADVLVAFPGASARDVENLVARPGEQVLSRMHGVEHVYSMSRPGMAVITVQFDVGVKYNDAVLRLHDTIQSHADWLPPNLGVQPPLVKPRGIDDVPIVSLTFWTKDPARSAYELQQVARAVEIELKRIKGTRDISTLGGPDHAIRVLLDAEKMNAYGVTPQDVAATLKLSNALQSSGSLTAGNAAVDRSLTRRDRSGITVAAGVAAAAAVGAGEALTHGLLLGVNFHMEDFSGERQQRAENSAHDAEDGDPFENQSKIHISALLSRSSCRRSP